MGRMSDLFYRLIGLVFVLLMTFGLSLLLISGVGMIVGVLKGLFK
jgi:hypothetical protein